MAETRALSKLSYEEFLVWCNVLTPEYLIVLFLNADREKDKRKIDLLLEQAEVDRQKLGRILDKYGLSKRSRALSEK